jgi:hypothetical protein
MPFVRMDAPWPMQTVLNTVASVPELTVAVYTGISRLLALLPLGWVDFLMKPSMPDEESRKLAVELLRKSSFPANFFSLGCREIREVPQVFDCAALRLIPQTTFLFAGNDHWSPESHMHDLQTLREKQIIPDSVSVVYRKDLRHDYVSVAEQVSIVVAFCVEHIRKAVRQSRL